MEDTDDRSDLVSELRDIIRAKDELILKQQDQIRWNEKYNQRKEFREHLLLGLAIFTVIVCILGAITYGAVRSDDHDAKTAQLCIAAGNIWSHNDCLLTKR